MKKLLSGILSLAFVFGLVAGFATPSAQAEETNVDDWNGYKEWDLIDDVDTRLSDSDLNYKHGDVYNVDLFHEWRMEPKHIKIYRVNSDGTLQRYKTIYPTRVSSDGTTIHDNFNTSITSVYVPGNYYAVHTYQYEWSGEDGFFFTNNAERSYRFTITQ